MVICVSEKMQFELSKERQVRKKKTRTWTEAAKLALELYPKTPMGHKDIFNVIRAKGLKDVSGPASLACLNAMLHVHSRGPEAMFYRVAGCTSVFGLTSNIPDGGVKIEVDEEESGQDFDPGDSDQDSGASVSLNEKKDDRVLYVRLPPGCKNSPLTVNNNSLCNHQVDDSMMIKSDQLTVKPLTYKNEYYTRVRRMNGENVAEDSKREKCNQSSAANVPISSPAKVSQSHSQRAIKHALRQQQKRRRRNTAIAASGSAPPPIPRIIMKSLPPAPTGAGCVPEERWRCSLEKTSLRESTRHKPQTMRELLASIPGLSFKPRKRSNRKLSTAAQIAQTKKGCINIETPDSILVNTNLRALLNKHTFACLPAVYQYRLVQLLPQADRMISPDYSVRLTGTALSNEFFARACQEWKKRLQEGEFTPENQMKLKGEAERDHCRLDPWKIHNFEPVWGHKSSSDFPDPGKSSPFRINSQLKTSLPNKTKHVPTIKIRPVRYTRLTASILRQHISDQELLHSDENRPVADSPLYNESSDMDTSTAKQVPDSLFGPPSKKLKVSETCSTSSESQESSEESLQTVMVPSPCPSRTPSPVDSAPSPADSSHETDTAKEDCAEIPSPVPISLAVTVVQTSVPNQSIVPPITIRSIPIIRSNSSKKNSDGGINLERSYQICNATVESSSKKEKLANNVEDTTLQQAKLNTTVSATPTVSHTSVSLLIQKEDSTLAQPLKIEATVDMPKEPQLPPNSTLLATCPLPNVCSSVASPTVSELDDLQEAQPVIADADMSDVDVDIPTCDADTPTLDVDTLPSDVDMPACDADAATCNADMSASDADTIACDDDTTACHANATACDTTTTIAFDATTKACYVDMSACDVDMPACDVVTPACDVVTSACNVDTTTSDVDTRVCDVDTTVCDVDTPVCDVDTQVCDDMYTPICEVVTPVCDVDTPVCDVHMPVCDVDTPAGEDTSAGEDMPAGEEGMQVDYANMPTCVMDQPTCDADMPTCNTIVPGCDEDVLAHDVDVPACNADVPACNVNTSACDIKLEHCDAQKELKLDAISQDTNIVSNEFQPDQNPKMSLSPLKVAETRAESPQIISTSTEQKEEVLMESVEATMEHVDDLNTEPKSNDSAITVQAEECVEMTGEVVEDPMDKVDSHVEEGNVTCCAVNVILDTEVLSLQNDASCIASESIDSDSSSLQTYNNTQAVDEDSTIILSLPSSEEENANSDTTEVTTENASEKEMTEDTDSKSSIIDESSSSSCINNQLLLTDSNKENFESLPESISKVTEDLCLEPSKSTIDCSSLSEDSIKSEELTNFATNHSKLFEPPTRPLSAPSNFIRASTTPTSDVNSLKRPSSCQSYYRRAKITPIVYFDSPESDDTRSDSDKAESIPSPPSSSAISSSLHPPTSAMLTYTDSFATKNGVAVSGSPSSGVRMATGLLDSDSSSLSCNSNHANSSAHAQMYEVPITRNSDLSRSASTPSSLLSAKPCLPAVHHQPSRPNSEGSAVLKPGAPEHPLSLPEGCTGGTGGSLPSQAVSVVPASAQLPIASGDIMFPSVNDVGSIVGTPAGDTPPRSLLQSSPVINGASSGIEGAVTNSGGNSRGGGGSTGKSVSKKMPRKKYFLRKRNRKLK